MPNQCTCSNCTPTSDTRVQMFAKFIVTHYAALSANVNTDLTYLVSSVGFPEHVGMTHHPVIHPQNVGDIAFLSSVLFLEVMLAIGNQIAMPARIKQIYFAEPKCTKAKTPCTRITQNTILITSALYKAVVSSASQFALLYTFSPFELSLIITIALFPGNLAAQCVQFLGPLFESIGLFKKPGFANFFSIYCAACYALSNSCMYFNTFDAAFRNIGWLNDRLIAQENMFATLGMITNIIMSVNFTLSTYQFFNNKMVDLFEKEKKTLTHYASIPFSERITLSSVTASLWKINVNCLAVINAWKYYTLEKVGYWLASLTYIGNEIYQQSLYAKTDKEVYRTRNARTTWWWQRCFNKQGEELPLVDNINLNTRYSTN